MRGPGDNGFIHDTEGVACEVIELSTGVSAILHEVEVLLEVLLTSGEPNMINLRGFPLRRADRVVLKEILGRGEVRGIVETAETTCLWETTVAGVWWLEHHNQKEEILGEAIEITDIPDLLITDTKDIRKGLVRLRRWLSQVNQVQGD